MTTMRHPIFTRSTATTNSRWESCPSRFSVGMPPGRVKSLVLEWGALHQEDLMADWDHCRNAQPLLPILPLE